VDWLRASGKHEGKSYQYEAITGGAAAREPGIAESALLIEFSEAIIVGDDARLAKARDEVVRRLGAAALVDAAAVAALFNGIDRVADATGITLEDDKAASTAEIRAAIGIDEFAKAKQP
jgi:hypothetical protein